MGQVTVSLNGRSYRLACDDGEEDRLRALADHVRQKLDTLTKEFGQAGETRLLVMASLMLADDLLDAKSDAKATTKKNEKSNKSKSAKDDPAEDAA